MLSQNSVKNVFSLNKQYSWVKNLLNPLFLEKSVYFKILQNKSLM